MGITPSEQVSVSTVQSVWIDSEDYSDNDEILVLTDYMCLVD